MSINVESPLFPIQQQQQQQQQKQQQLALIQKCKDLRANNSSTSIYIHSSHFDETNPQKSFYKTNLPIFF